MQEFGSMMLTRPALHPGDVLKDVLGDISYKGEELALQLDLSPTELAGVLDGVLPVTENLAERLPKVFGGDAQLWLSIQAAFDRGQQQGSAQSACP